MGSKGNQTQQQTSQNQTYTPDPRIQQAGYQALGMAQNAASQPFQMPVAPVAGLNAFQNQAFGQIQNMQGMSQPYFNEGQNYLEQSAQGPTANDINSFYNPMAQNVTNQMQNIFGQQQSQATRSAVGAAGGIGADRIAVAQGNLANQQGLAAGQTYAGLYQQALQAAQQQKQMQAGAGYGIAQMGPAAQAAALQGTQALAGAGNQQQAQTQAELNAPYQNQLARIAYPFQTAQYMAGITGGLAPAMGGTTTGSGASTTTYPTPSPLSQGLGIGAAGLGLAGSLGAFGGGNPSTAGGGSTFTPNDGSGAMDVSGAPMNYFRRGGRMAMGGDPGDDSGDQGGMVEPIPGISIPKGSGMSPIPYLPLQSGSGQFHNNLNLTPPAPQKQDSGDSGLGSIAKIAATVLPFFLARGGSVSPYDMGQGFDEGGDVDPEALAYDSGGDKGESWSPPDNSPYDTAGARAPEPHMTMSDVTKRAKEYYLGDGDQTPEAMAAEATPTQTTNTAVPDIQTDMPPYAAQSAAAAPQAGVPMPQRRPDIAGPAGQGNFSPQTPPLTPQQIAQETMFAANKYGIPQDLALRLVRRESGFRNIRGAAGEYGPTQLMPGTAREMGVSDPSNTYENIHGGMQYLKKMYDRYGNWGQAVAAYNAGPGNVDRGRIPASTQAYVKDVNGDGRVDVNDLSAKQQAEHGDTGSPYGGGSNRDMSMATEQMPRSQQPYPDSLQRDWGQNATRSPWMALVKAGAAMASSTGPIGSVIGKGIAAGAGELDNQRKELRSEEDINNKAGALYQQAKQHLNQYQRLTPYQNELIKAGKGNYQSLGKDPDTGEEVLIDRRTGQLVDTGRVLNPTQKSTALQSNIEWLKSRGIGKDDQERFQIAHSGVNNAATFGRLVQAEKKFLSGLPEGAGKSDAELETAARANVTNRGFQANPGAAGRATPTPKDIQWVKDHPETAGAFKERFGIDPPKE